MASIPFPSLLQNNTPENGLWCRVCDRIFERYRFRQLAPNVVSDLVPPSCNASRIFLGMQCRARSNGGFLEHITDCHGAREQDFGLEWNIPNWFNISCYKFTRQRLYLTIYGLVDASE
jgi:hypothetical protein